MRKLSILIVDDAPDVCSLLAHWLRAHHTACVYSGADALTAVTLLHFDLVITDIVMPGMEGIETIKQIRRFRPNIKIIAISGSASRDVYLNASSKLGAQAILDKPFRGAELRDLVKRVLSEQGAEPE